MTWEMTVGFVAHWRGMNRISKRAIFSMPTKEEAEQQIEVLLRKHESKKSDLRNPMEEETKKD